MSPRAFASAWWLGLVRVLTVGWVVCLAACQSLSDVKPTPLPGDLWRDADFAAPAQPVRPEDVFALTPAMERYMNADILPFLRRDGGQRGLIAALQSRNMLRLDYDSAVTRTASQAFAARSGNCLSLVIMTAALANYLDMPVTFQSVEVEDSWTRGQSLLIVAGHVNVSLGVRMMERARGYKTDLGLTIDFLPPQDLGTRRVSAISRQRVLAMFFNNRAAETLEQGDINQAYAYSRAALQQDPSFQSAKITLAVIYHRRGLLDAAEATLRNVLQSEPHNTPALADLAAVQTTQGRDTEAAQTRQLLAQLETVPPFHFFDLGRAAVQRGDYEAGRAYLKRELARDPDYHEVHYWLAVAYVGLGDGRSAQRHLNQALANSNTRGEHDLYAAKLDRLQAKTIR